MFAQSIGLTSTPLFRRTPRMHRGTSRNRQHKAELKQVVDQPQMRVWHEQDDSFGPPLSMQNSNGEGLVWDLLGEVPNLEYRAENDHVYVVSGLNGLALAVPKARDRQEVYVSPQGDPLAVAFRCLGLALLGLPLAGFGTFLFVLPAMWLACRILVGKSRTQADQTRALAALTIAAILLSVALTLNILFFHHVQA